MDLPLRTGAPVTLALDAEPIVILHHQDGGTTYRVDTLEQGVWVGELLEASGP